MKNRKMWKKIRVNWMLYLFMLPAIAYYIVFHYIPIYGVQIAFQDYRIGEAFGESESCEPVAQSGGLRRKAGGEGLSQNGYGSTDQILPMGCGVGVSLYGQAVC